MIRAVQIRRYCPAGPCRTLRTLRTAKSRKRSHSNFPAPIPREAPDCDMGATRGTPGVRRARAITPDLPRSSELVLATEQRGSAFLSARYETGRLLAYSAALVRVESRSQLLLRPPAPSTRTDRHGSPCAPPRSSARSAGSHAPTRRAAPRALRAGCRLRPTRRCFGSNGACRTKAWSASAAISTVCRIRRGAAFSTFTCSPIPSASSRTARSSPVTPRSKGAAKSGSIPRTAKIRLCRADGQARPARP